MINTVQWFIVNPVKIRLEIKKKEKIRMQKRNILAIFVGLIIGLYTVLGMSLFTFFNLKYHSVYYAQHIPHKEGTEPDIIMLMENNDWIYTPETDDMYLLNRHFSIQHAFDKRYHKIKYNQRKVIKEIRETVQPVIDAQTKPLINLQWLFNLIYQSRFN